MSAFGWFPDEVHLEGYGEGEDAERGDGEDGQWLEETIADGDEEDSELSELTDEE